MAFVALNRFINQPFLPNVYPSVLPNVYPSVLPNVYPLTFQNIYPIKSPNKVDINIEKNKINSLLTDDNIKFLKTKINELNTIYNIILKHLCIKRKNMNNLYNVFDNVKRELTYLNIFNKYCIGSTTLVPNIYDNLVFTPFFTTTTYTKPTVAIGLTLPLTIQNTTEHVTSEYLSKLTTLPTVNDYNQILNSQLIKVDKTFLDAYLKTLGLTFPLGKVNGKCDDMFDDNRLRKLIDSMFNDRLLSKVCQYKIINNQIVVNNLPANVQIAGGNNFNIINISTIIKDRDNSGYTHKKICFGIDNNLKCYDNNINKDHKMCDFCDKWTEDRKLFKSQLIDMLNNNLNSNIDSMTNSLDLLPAVILDQTHFNKFYSLYNTFVNQKNR